MLLIKVKVEKLEKSEEYKVVILQIYLRMIFIPQLQLRELNSYIKMSSEF